MVLPTHHLAPHEPDESLVVRVLAGDRSAFDGLYDRYFPCLLAHAAKGGGSRWQVEAAVEKAFAAVLSSLEEFQRQDGRVSFGAWVFLHVTRSSAPKARP